MEELINDSKNGDNTAFTKLIELTQNDLYRIAKARLNSDDDISDAIQNTMIHAYQHIKKLKDNQYFKTWIIKILINECNQIYRKKNKNRNLFTKINTRELTELQEEKVITKIDAKIDFEILIQKLNYQEKIIIILHYATHHSYTEIADILKLNVNTVKTKLKRAKDKMKMNYKGGNENE